MKIVNLKIKELEFADYNPRQMTEVQVTQLQKSLKTFGFVEPIVVNNFKGRENIIVGGHMRVRVAKKMGMKEVPAVYVSLPLKKEKELNVRLNKNLGDWDWDLIANFDTGMLLDIGFTKNQLGIEIPDLSKDKDKFDDSMDSYLKGSIRQIVLYFNKKQYDKAMEDLKDLMKKLEVDSHTAVFIELVKMFYEKNPKKEKRSKPRRFRKKIGPRK